MVIMPKSNLTKIFIFFLLISLFGCGKKLYPDPIAVEERLVRHCQYIDTVSEVTDPGKIVFPAKCSNPYDGERIVLERAGKMGASHIVWLYNHPIGSSASAYRCGD